MPPRRKSKTPTRRRVKPMLKVLPAVEGYVLANIATQNLFGGSPLQFILGDLNAQSGSGALAQAMGPQPGIITLKEILTGSMNTSSTTRTYSGLGGKGQSTTSYAMTGGVIDQVQQNFMDNIGNIIVGTALSTAGFRVAKRVLRKPVGMANRQLKAMGLGSTIQL